jgi:hypothetical protein
MVYTFVHINKSAGRSINQALQSFCQQHGLPYEEIHGKVGKVTNNSKRKYILFLRDPIDRFISSYHYHRQRRGPLPDINTLIPQTHKYFTTNLHFYYSLATYVTPSCAQFTNWFFVGFFNNVQKDFNRLIDTIKQDAGLSSTVAYPKLFTTNKTTRLHKQVSQENIEQLRNQIYKLDYDTLQVLYEKGYIPEQWYTTVRTKMIYEW